jgi:hypothetical protein
MQNAYVVTIRDKDAPQHTRETLEPNGVPLYDAGSDQEGGGSDAEAAPPKDGAPLVFAVVIPRSFIVVCSMVVCSWRRC